MTLSPGLNDDTLEPTALTTPEPSEPGTVSGTARVVG